MAEPLVNPNLLRRWRSAVVIGVAIGLSMGIYSVVAAILAFSVPPYQGVINTALPLWLRPAAIGLAFVMFFVIRAVRRRILASDGLSMMMEQIMVPKERYRRLLLASIVGFALAEAVALIGFVMFLFSGDPWDAFTLGAAALLFLVLDFPRLSAWQAHHGRASVLR